MTLRGGGRGHVEGGKIFLLWLWASLTNSVPIAENWITPSLGTEEVIFKANVSDTITWVSQKHGICTQRSLGAFANLFPPNEPIYYEQPHKSDSVALRDWIKHKNKALRRTVEEVLLLKVVTSFYCSFLRWILGNDVFASFSRRNTSSLCQGLLSRVNTGLRLIMSNLVLALFLFKIITNTVSLFPFPQL